MYNIRNKQFSCYISTSQTSQYSLLESCPVCLQTWSSVEKTLTRPQQRTAVLQVPSWLQKPMHGARLHAASNTQGSQL